MKLKYKILIGFVVLIVMLLGIVGYTLRFLNQTNTRINRITGKQFETQKLVQSSNLVVMQIRSDIWDAMLLSSESRMEQVKRLQAAAVTFYENVRLLKEQLPAKDADLDALNTVFRTYFVFGTRILEYKDLAEFNSRPDTIAKFKENQFKLFDLLDAMVASATAEYDQALAALRHDFQDATMFVAVLTAIVLALAVVMALVISGTLTRPVDALMQAIKQFQGGNLDAQAVVHSRDELGLLAEAFNAMSRAIKASVAQRQEQARLKQEMELARHIQTALLPKDFEHGELEIATIMLPAEEVGGDYYDLLYDEDGHLWIGIGDVSGHGVTPGLIMMMAQTIKTTLVSTLGARPAEIVIRLNRVLYQNVHERLGADHFMTFTALTYLGQGRFEHAGAHLTMFVYRQATGSLELIKTTGTWLNFIPDIAHATHNAAFTLEIGDILALYTDGLTEAHSPEGELLDARRFQDIILSHVDKPTQALRDAIMEDVLTWCNQQRDDDMTLVVVRRVH